MTEILGDEGGRYLAAHDTVPALLREIHTLAVGISSDHDVHKPAADRIRVMADKALGIIRGQA